MGAVNAPIFYCENQPLCAIIDLKRNDMATLIIEDSTPQAKK